MYLSQDHKLYLHFWGFGQVNEHVSLIQCECLQQINVYIWTVNDVSYAIWIYISHLSFPILFFIRKFAPQNSYTWVLGISQSITYTIPVYHWKFKLETCRGLTPHIPRSSSCDDSNGVCHDYDVHVFKWHLLCKFGIVERDLLLISGFYLYFYITHVLAICLLFSSQMYFNFEIILYAKHLVLS